MNTIPANSEGSNQTSHPSSGMKRQRKWIIGLCPLAGMLLATTYYLTQRPMYESTAKLFVRSVSEVTSLVPLPVQSLPLSGEALMNLQLETLTSLDLALSVAEKIGPEKLLAEVGGGTNRISAALLVLQNSRAQISTNSNVIQLTFRHPDPTVVQPVLGAIIEQYQGVHARIHRLPEIIGDYLRAHSEMTRAELGATDDELRRARQEMGVVLSLEYTKRLYGEQISKITDELWHAKAELAERQRTLSDSDAEVTRLQSKIKVLDEDLSRVLERAKALEEGEGRIADAQRKKEVLQKQYDHFSAALERWTMERELGPGLVNGITVLQAPSPPMITLGRAVLPCAGILMVSILAGVAVFAGGLKRQLSMPFSKK